MEAAAPPYLIPRPSDITPVLWRFHSPADLCGVSGDLAALKTSTSEPGVREEDDDGSEKMLYEQLPALANEVARVEMVRDYVGEYVKVSPLGLRAERKSANSLTQRDSARPESREEPEQRTEQIEERKKERRKEHRAERIEQKEERKKEQEEIRNNKEERGRKEKEERRLEEYLRQWQGPAPYPQLLPTGNAPT